MGLSASTYRENGLRTRLGGMCLVLMASTALAAAPAPAPASQLDQAKAAMKAMADSVQWIERLVGMTTARAVRGGCVAEKLAEARAGVQIGSRDLGIIEDALAHEPAADTAGGHAAGARKADPAAKKRAEDVAHALTRLELLADRSRELKQAARICTDEDLGAVDITQVEVQIAPAVPDGDPTATPGPPPLTPDRPAKN